MGNGKAYEVKVSALPVIMLDDIGEHEADRFNTSVTHYRVGTGYYTNPEPLPTALHAFLLELQDETEGQEGDKRVIVGAPDKTACAIWLEAVQNIQTKTEQVTTI